jgi:hypothetical protein
MTNTIKYQDGDLVAVVWPRQSQPLVTYGAMTWEEAARGGWAMDSEKADNVRVLIAVFDDIVVGAWAVRGATHKAEIPEGKSRMVSRSWFETVDDTRLNYLLGARSPRDRQRNPQATFALRDLPGGDDLIGDTPPAQHGLVRLGQFTLTVSEDGHAELRMPAGAALTVRTAA